MPGGTMGAVGAKPAAAAAAPPSLSNVRAVWWAGDLALADADPVDSWVDRVNGVTVSSTLTARPTYRASQINGKPAVEFDGSNDYLMVSAALNTTDAQGCIVAVVANDLPGTLRVLWSHTNAAASNVYFYGCNHTTSGEPRMDFAQGALNRAQRGNTALGTGARLIEWASDAANWSMRVDGTTQTLTTVAAGSHGQWFSGQTSPNRWTVGALTFNNTRQSFFDGKLAYLAVLSQPLSSGDRTALNAWVAAHYGLTIA